MHRVPSLEEVVGVRHSASRAEYQRPYIRVHAALDEEKYPQGFHLSGDPAEAAKAAAALLEEEAANAPHTRSQRLSHLLAAISVRFHASAISDARPISLSQTRQHAWP